MISSRFVLYRYLNRALMGRILICAAVLISLLEILALLEKSTPILSRGLGLSGILTFATLHLPALTVEILPLATLIGGLFFLTKLALSSEMSALRAAGLSTTTLYKHFIPTILLVGLSGTVLQYWIVPPCEKALSIWWNTTDPDAESSTHALWFRAGATLARIGQHANGGTLLHDVTLYHRTPEGLLASAEHADTLTFTGTTWQASTPHRLALSPDHTTTTLTEMENTFPLPATPPDIITLSEDSAAVSPAQIAAILHKGAPTSLPRATYRMTLFSGIILPFQVAVMLLMALPVIYIPPRAGLRNPLPVYALAAGMGIVILQGLISALGNAGTIAPPLATIAGPLIGTLFGLTWLLRLEER